MSISQEMLDTAKSETSTKIMEVATTARRQFLDLFGSFLSTDDLTHVDDLFTKSVHAKVGSYMASSLEEASEFTDIYESYMETIETIGDKYMIVGKAKAGVLLRSVAHQIISGIFAVAGAVLQAGLSILIPGVGNLLGAAANAGLQHVVAWAQGG